MFITRTMMILLRATAAALIAATRAKNWFRHIGEERSSLRPKQCLQPLQPLCNEPCATPRASIAMASVMRLDSASFTRSTSGDV